MIEGIFCPECCREEIDYHVVNGYICFNCGQTVEIIRNYDGEDEAIIKGE